MNRPFVTPYGTFNLKYPKSKGRETQQGWNQADAYLVEQLSQLDIPQSNIALINESYGALACALENSKHQLPEVFNDSASYNHWHSINCALPAADIQPAFQLEQSQATVFLLKLPKNLAYFEYILSMVSKKPDAIMLVAGMQKHWPSSFYQAAEKYFESMEVLPAVKKAKCMILSKGQQTQEVRDKFTLELPEWGITLVNHVNVFAQQQLDIGSRLFIEHFPDLSDVKSLIDLGCGNGLLGIYALKQQPGLHVDFVDESYSAIRSCQDSLKASELAASDVQIWHNDCLFGLDLPKVDAVVCNPPFHQQHQVSTQVAETMIRQSALQLKSGGKLFLIGNRHLQYQKTLKRHFGDVNQTAANNKFAIFEAVAT